MSGVLVLRALGLGDLLVAVPALRGLRRAFPGERITLAAPEQFRDLLSEVVDEVLPTSGLGALRAPPERPSVLVNLHGSGPESLADLDAVAEGAPVLTHAHPAFPHHQGPQWIEDQPERVRWCRLLAHYGIDADPDELGIARPGEPSPAPGAVVVHPGAAFAARRWPAARFSAVARELAATGWRVVITGSAAERELAEEVAAGAGLGPGAVFAGRTDLRTLTALVSEACLLVCGDTGVAHLATARGTASVLLFGPTPPSRWGPPPGRPEHVVLWPGTTGDPFAARPDPGLLRIEVPDVVSAARLALGGVRDG
ncbi:glycosyltransferase family 9 protein [Amycolatopsis sp. 195334CR]|uniref:glycosyltransferase family 9 protein n=1 Tax=Amycolatopsis sp. 195334CR TaxID=2814588 RepID=UPI001A8D304E|nr:glycosyltransferase family 9 protein [Amycolatopsis sp. 195334CR]MBN6038387.1 glycosyltransferase family 9 protein [Amycolatopsis sp. 195334CR]